MSPYDAFVMAVVLAIDAPTDIDGSLILLPINPFFA